jgi:hypothetical protein
MIEFAVTLRSSRHGDLIGQFAALGRLVYV